jgi:uncharacterized membrane protein YhaH (DUF805 family)
MAGRFWPKATEVRGLFSLNGRTSRIGFWRTLLFVTLMTAVAWVIALFAILQFGPPAGVLLLALAPLLYMNFAVCVRRLHDRDKSWWWLLGFILIPLVAPALKGHGVGILALAIMSLIGIGVWIWGWVEIGFRAGVARPNRFGPATGADAF